MHLVVDIFAVIGVVAVVLVLAYAGLAVAVAQGWNPFR